MHFDAKTVIQRTPLKLIYFLTFDEASVKKQYEICNILNCIVCYTVFFSFWFFLDFSWSFSKKNWKKSLMAFQCQDCDTIFSSYIDFVPDFSWSFSKKSVRNLLWHFNAKTVIQCFLFTLIFLTFHKESAKHWKKPLMAFHCQDCDTKYSFYIDFLESFNKVWRSFFMTFKALK